MQSIYAKSSENLYFQQPAHKYMVYQVNTNNCYDSVIEQNLNTGLPKQISCITSKHMKGKRARKKQDDSDLSYEEKELNLRFHETWLE